MRNKTIRMKRIRAQRIVDDYMRWRPRIITPLFDYRDTNMDALQQSRLWAIPGPVIIERKNQP